MPDILDRLKTALVNRYTIQREIGAGGMATVYLAAAVAVLTTVIVVATRRAAAPESGPWHLTDRQPLTFTGLARNPRLSPDGGLLAYLEEGSSNKLLVRDLRNGGTIEVFDAGEDRIDHRWASEGNELEVDVRHVGNEDEPSGLWSSRFVISPAGGPPRNVERLRWPFQRFLVSLDGSRAIRWFGFGPLHSLIVEGQADSVYTDTLDVPMGVLDVQWAPNGRWLLAANRRDRDSVWLSLVPLNEDELPKRIFSATSTGLLSAKFLGDGIIAKVGDDFVFVPMRWEQGSPGATVDDVATIEDVRGWDVGRDSTIVYARRDHTNQIWIVKVVDEHGRRVGRESQVTDGTSLWREVAVSPDGMKVAAVRAVGERQQLVMLSLEAGSEDVLAEAEIIANPQWSHDGKRLSIDSDVTGQPRLTVMDLENGGVVAVGDSSLFHRAARPLFRTWGPAGDKIYVHTPDNHPLSEDACLVEVDVNTGQERGISERYCGFPMAVSPDGKSVLLTKGGTCQMAAAQLLDVESETMRPITWEFASPAFAFGSMCGYPVSWTSDGLFYYATLQTGSHPESLWWVPAGASTATEFVTFPSNGVTRRPTRRVCFLLSVSTDGRTLACIVDEYQTDIWIARLVRDEGI